MTNNKTTNPDNSSSIKDNIASVFHGVIIDVQHMADEGKPGTEDFPKSGENSFAQPEELPAKKPEVELGKKIPEENPGIIPGSEEGMIRMKGQSSNDTTGSSDGG